MSLRRLLWATLFVLTLFSPLRAQSPLREIVDRELQKTWAAKQLIPVARSSDAEFLRRIYLDLTGLIPTLEEAQTFLDDPAADKRAKLIDKLIDSPRFAVHQADLWDMVLFGRNPPGYETRRRDGVQRWLEKQFAENRPYDQWVRAFLEAEGDSVDAGPSLFYQQYNRHPEDAIEAITQTFLGVQLQCARCHDHPFESWTQLDFYGMAAFLSRVEVVDVGKKESLTRFVAGEHSSGEILFTGPAKDQEPGKKGDPVKPKFLLGSTLEEPELPKDFKEDRNFPGGKMPPPPRFSRKNQLAAWIASRDNHFFARAIANRLWAQFFGRGIVHPVDNMSESNKPSHPELLEAITSELVAHKFDLKWLIRELVNTHAYQLASTGQIADAFPEHFERARVRPLSAEELLESWRQATWYDRAQELAGKKDKENKRLHGVTWDYLVRFFGTPNNGVGDFQGGLQEHLYLNNGELGRLMTSEKGGLIDLLVKDPSLSPEQRVEKLYLSFLSRRPTTDETAKLVEFLGSELKDGERLRDVFWALMTCAEFRFNH